LQACCHFHDNRACPGFDGLSGPACPGQPVRASLSGPACSRFWAKSKPCAQGSDICASRQLSHHEPERPVADLKENLPTLGSDVDRPEPSDANVVSLPKQIGTPLNLTR